MAGYRRDMGARHVRHEPRNISHESIGKRSYQAMVLLQEIQRDLPHKDVPCIKR